MCAYKARVSLTLLKISFLPGKQKVYCQRVQSILYHNAIHSVNMGSKCPIEFRHNLLSVFQEVNVSHKL